MGRSEKNKAREEVAETPAEPGTAQVTLTLPRALLTDLDGHARAERRTRSNAATLLLERALAALRTKPAATA